MPERSRRDPRLAVATALGFSLGCALAPGRACADTVTATSVLLQQSTLVINQQSNAYSFTAPGAGTLTVQLQDLVWPAALSSVSFSLDTPQNVLGWVSSAGALTLTVASGGTYYTDVTAQAGGSLNLGLYSLQVDFYPQVPLPAGIFLMLGGLGVLGFGAYVARTPAGCAMKASCTPISMTFN